MQMHTVRTVPGYAYAFPVGIAIIISTHYRLCYGNTTIPVLMYARACNTQFQAEHEIAGLKAREVVVGAQCCRDVRVARRTQRAHIRPVSLPGKQQHAGNK